MSVPSFSGLGACSLGGQGHNSNNDHHHDGGGDDDDDGGGDDDDNNHHYHGHHDHNWTIENVFEKTTGSVLPRIQ